METAGAVQMQFHHDGVFARSIVVSSQTSFFKAQFAVQTSGGDVRATHFKRHQATFFRLCFVYRFRHQRHPDSSAPERWMYRDIEDMALVRDEPSAKKARGLT